MIRDGWKRESWGGGNGRERISAAAKIVDKHFMNTIFKLNQTNFEHHILS